MENNLKFNEEKKELTEIIIDEVEIHSLDNLIKFTNHILEMKKQHNLNYTVYSIKYIGDDY